MAKRAADSNRSLTPLEALIMDAVWTLSRASVRQVRDHLKPVKPMAYNTALTMMRILRDKGFLASTRVGRRDVYRPLVSRRQEARRSLRQVLDRFFAGSPAALMSQLLESKGLDGQQIRAIRREVDRKLRRGRRTQEKRQ